MANTLRFNAPELPSDAENKNETEKKESGIWGIVDKDLQQGLNETHDSAYHYLNIKNANEKISFQDAVKQTEGVLDLTKTLHNTLKSHRAWGLIDAHIKAGIVTSEEEYADLLSHAEVNKRSLEKVVAENQNHTDKYLAILDTDQFGPADLFQIIFENNNIPVSREEAAYENLDRIRRVSPLLVPSLEDLHTVSESEQRAALIAAFFISPRLKPTQKPRLIFTSNEKEPSNVNRSAVHDLQDMANGEMELIDPTADFLRFRMQIDKGVFETCQKLGLENPEKGEYSMILKKLFLSRSIHSSIPDFNKLTRYSNYFFENGTVLTMHFDPYRHKIFLQNMYPNEQSVIFGSRTIL